MQQVFKQNEFREFKAILLGECNEETAKFLNGPGCQLLWNWFNSDEYEKLCENWSKINGTTVTIPGLGEWKIDIIFESCCLEIKQDQILICLWMVPDWNSTNLM